MYRIIIILLFLVIFEVPSYSYLGPGLGGGVIAATLGLIIAIFAAIFGILWFPIKRLIKKRSSRKENKKNWFLISLLFCLALLSMSFWKLQSSLKYWVIILAFIKNLSDW